MRSLTKLAVATVIALTLGCGNDSSGPARIEVEGNWSGSFNLTSGTPVTLNMTLTETSGSVSGNGTLVSAGSSIAETISGTYSRPQVSLNFHSEGFSDSNLSGTVGETTITGTLTGSGFQNLAITLTRQ
jgi:hypothetical protein